MPVRPGHDLRHRAAVDDRVHQRVLALHARRVRRSSFAEFAPCRLSRALRAGLLDRVALLADLARRVPSPSPVALRARPAARLGDVLAALEVGDALGVAGRHAALAFEELDLGREVLDLAAGVFERRRRRGLAQRDAGAHRVEQAHRLVGQLAVRHVPRREPHGIDHRFVEDADLVVLLQHRHEAAEHADRLLLVRLVDLDLLEAALERGVGLEVLLVLGEGGGRDGAQFAAGERRLEQVGRVVLPGLRRRRR